MAGSRPTPSFLHATLILFAGSLVGAAVKCPSNNLAEVTRGAKEYVLVCGYPTKGSTILQGSNIENAEDCADLCSQKSRCVHAEWRPSEKTCSLKSDGNIAVIGEAVYNWRKKGTELDFEDDEQGFPDIHIQDDEEGFPEPGDEEGFPDPGDEEGFPDPGTGEGDSPSSCPAAFAGLDIETAVRDSMEVCCPDASADHEVLIKEYMAIVNSALNLLGKYCDKSCEPPAALCFGLPVHPEVVQTAGTTVELRDLPQNSLAKENHVFDFDTLLGPVKPGFELYKSRRAMTPIQRPFGRTFYLIRAGTQASDLQYIASGPTELQYYASCSEDTPCVYSNEKPWTSYTFGPGAELVIDFSTYEQDMVLSVADLYATSEQHAVFIDGKEIGRTHGALSLKGRGKDPYDPAMMSNDHVGDLPDGPAKSIIGRGFWGSFKIPKGSKSVVVKMIYPTNNFKGAGAYRIDKSCDI
ncbi:uncharacterized protein FMAN_05312 [Fusarium mangiferae]|uniref:Apple domain-containing protein n=1 Tax=Fusarium mangiferae TaxID=192010 RepID=A0A1L7STR4_FUSMA|nr:uncharacterized protein FMAN_05312 [Fusarium mangiferae]CVK87862.1 uncharacterized protein FMAN_05312 [Fusarium mangiferae]